jgi:hypothetical protein
LVPTKGLELLSTVSYYNRVEWRQCTLQIAKKLLILSICNFLPI